MYYVRLINLKGNILVFGRQKLQPYRPHLKKRLSRVKPISFFFRLISMNRSIIGLISIKVTFIGVLSVSNGSRPFLRRIRSTNFYAASHFKFGIAFFSGATLSFSGALL
jgi:hypothetical protein